MPEEKNRQDASGEPKDKAHIEGQVQPSGNQSIPTEPVNNDSENNEGETAKLAREIKGGEKWLIGIGIATLLINSIIAVIYRGQLREMRKSTDAATRAATSASEQTKLMSQQIEETNQAILAFGNAYVDDRGVRANFTNIGHYAATQLTGAVIITLRTVPSNQIIKRYEPLPFSNRSIPPAPVLTIEQAQDRNVFQWETSFHPSASERKMIDDGKAAVMAEMSFSYNNGFRTIQDGGCAAYLSFPTIVIRKPPEGGVIETGGPGGVLSCADFPKAMIEDFNRYSDALRQKKEYENQQHQ